MSEEVMQLALDTPESVEENLDNNEDTEESMDTSVVDFEADVASSSSCAAPAAVAAGGEDSGQPAQDNNGTPIPVQAATTQQPMDSEHHDYSQNDDAEPANQQANHTTTGGGCGGDEEKDVAVVTASIDAGGDAGGDALEPVGVGAEVGGAKGGTTSDAGDGDAPSVGGVASGGDASTVGGGEGDNKDRQVEQTPTQSNGQTEPTTTTTTQQKEDEDMPDDSNSDLKKLWDMVNMNRNDFIAWTYLLQHVEQTGVYENMLKAYNEFLIKYPYCYGYWKKYADIEQDNNAKKLVYERAVEAIPVSVDLWVFYLNFTIAEFSDEEGAKEAIRSLFTRASSCCGLDFRSEKFWDLWLTWETTQGNLTGVTSIYDQLIAIPMRQYKIYYDRYKEHITSNNPRAILDQKVFADKLSFVTGGMATLDSEVTEETLDKIRKGLLYEKSVLFNQLETRISKVWSYEAMIRRPYFHAKPLEKGQLKNWRSYLNMVIECEDEVNVDILFRRCLVCCSLYEEFWQMYADYAEEKKKDISLSRLIYRSACEVHVSHKPQIHMSWSVFEERHGDQTKAKEILVKFGDSFPGLAMVTMRLIGFERRYGTTESVRSLYREVIQRSTNPHLSSFFSMKFARYETKIVGNRDEAKKILNEALKKDLGNNKLYLQLIDVEMESGAPINVEAVFTLLDRALAGPLNPRQIAAFSQRKLEFCEDFCNDINRLHKIYIEHRELMLQLPANCKRAKLTSDKKAATSKAAAYNDSYKQGQSSDYQQYPQNAYPQQHPQQPPQQQPPLNAAPYQPQSMYPPPNYPQYPVQGYQNGTTGYYQQHY